MPSQSMSNEHNAYRSWVQPCSMEQNILSRYFAAGSSFRSIRPIRIGTAVILSGTPYFAQLLPILMAGPLWFVILVPGAFFWSRPKSHQPLPKKEGARPPSSKETVTSL